MTVPHAFVDTLTDLRAMAAAHRLAAQGEDHSGDIGLARHHRQVARQLDQLADDITTDLEGVDPR